MLLKQATLEGVKDGRITLAFRRWKRPTVKAGGTLLTSVGLLSIDAVDRVEVDEIESSEAAAAGFADIATLRAALRIRREGSIYRVALHLAGPDPRIALREQIPETRAALEGIRTRLARLDAASKTGPWTGAVLTLLQRCPGVRAGDLCVEVGMDRARLKANVRKLKSLGLIESLGIGYRLSPRGSAVHRALPRPDRR